MHVKHWLLFATVCLEDGRTMGGFSGAIARRLDELLRKLHASQDFTGDFENASRSTQFVERLPISVPYTVENTPPISGYVLSFISFLWALFVFIKNSLRRFINQFLSSFTTYPLSNKLCFFQFLLILPLTFFVFHKVVFIPL